MSEYDDLLLDAYRGELLGAALFGAMATVRTGRERDQLVRWNGSSRERRSACAG